MRVHVTERFFAGAPPAGLRCRPSVHAGAGTAPPTNPIQSGGQSCMAATARAWIDGMRRRSWWDYSGRPCGVLACVLPACVAGGWRSRSTVDVGRPAAIIIVTLPRVLVVLGTYSACMRGFDFFAGRSIGALADLPVATTPCEDDEGATSPHVLYCARSPATRTACTDAEAV